MPERVVLSVERIFSDPPLTGGLPVEPRFTPDGAAIAFLRTAADDRERLDLWRHDIGSGTTGLWVPGNRLADLDGPLTEAEKAERERRRQFSRGITRFEFAPDGTRLLLPVGGAAFELTLADDALRCVTPPGTRQTDFRFDPTGRQVSYVRDGDLYVTDLETGRETRLTFDGSETVASGIADFIAQEEMHRFEGHWWSPDGRFIAYTRVDSSPIAVSQRYEIDADAIRVISQRYPYAGAANAAVELRVRELANGRETTLDWQLAPDDYLARVLWWGPRVVAQAQSRDQRRLAVLAFDTDRGSRTELFTDTASTWLNLHDNCRALDGDRLLWTSERSGHAQLYVYADGQLRQVTDGVGRVNRVLWARNDAALLLGWYGNPTEQHVYRADLAAEAPRPPVRITERAGWHDAVASADGRRLLDRCTAVDDPGFLGLIEIPDAAAPATPLRTIARERIEPGHPYHPYLEEHATPTLGVLEAEDGQLLHYRLTRPVRAPRPAAGHPVIVHVYGGPGVQRVKNEWPALLLQLLTRNGYGVLELDNRGSGNRSPAFEAPIHGRLGDVEVRDQLRGVEFLRSLDWVDPTRIGVFGHSYGGYMALMCLLKAPEAFRAAVSVAPVTDWALYDTHYTERYLGTPAANPAGYQASSVYPWLDGLRGRLLLIHGMADDNVLYTHSTRLYRALQARNRAFEMMAYPGAKHALQERDVSIHRFSLILDFFGRTL
jgi:dipeptidyl-peptidase-4